jgi:hypothetical protein
MREASLGDIIFSFVDTAIPGNGIVPALARFTPRIGRNW